MNIGTENNSDFIINNKSVNTNTSLPLFIPTYQHKLCEAFQQIILHSPTYFGTELGSFQVAYSVRQFKTKISRNFGGAVYCQLPDRWNQQYTNNKLAYKNFPFFSIWVEFWFEYYSWSNYNIILCLWPTHTKHNTRRNSSHITSVNDLHRVSQMPSEPKSPKGPTGPFLEPPPYGGPSALRAFSNKMYTSCGIDTGRPFRNSVLLQISQNRF